MIHATTVAACNFQWIGAVLADVGELVFGECAKVMNVIIFITRAVKNNITFHNYTWIKLAEKAYNNVFVVYFVFAVQKTKAWTGFEGVFYLTETFFFICIFFSVAVYLRT